MELRVTRIERAADGGLVRLCGHGWAHTVEEVVRSINDGQGVYFLMDDQGRTADVTVVNDAAGRRLVADPHAGCSVDLESLPDC